MTLILFLSFIIACLIVTVVVISSKRAREQMHIKQLEMKLFRFKALADNTDAGIFIKDHSLRYLYVNDAMANFYHESPEALLGKSDKDLILDTPSLEKIAQTDSLVLKEKKRIQIEEQTYDEKTKSHTIFKVIKFQITNPHNDADAIGGVCIDITQRKQLELDNYKMLYFDTITELPNYRVAQEKISELIHELEAHKQISAAIYINLKQLKHIHETKGRTLGSKLLKKVSLRLLQYTHQQALLYKYTEACFILLYPNLGTNHMHASQLALERANEVHHWLELPFYLNHEAFWLQPCLGVTAIFDPQQTVRTVTQEADIAMYYASQEHNQPVMFYDPSMRSWIEEYLLIENELSLAIERNQLELYVQPQHAPNGQLKGCEMLLRWHHPQRGIIPPDRFIPIAEKSQLINKLGTWVLQESFAFLARYPNELFTVSINLSPAQFKAPNFAQLLKQMIGKYQISTERLTLEVTEGLLMEDSETNASIMIDLVKMGISLAIDDYGTGYSNLSALTRLPIAELKIDRSLIVPISNDKAVDLLIVKSTIALAKQLGLRTVAEGVEDIMQLKHLEAMGCDIIQGYYFSKPMPINEWDDYYNRCVSIS